MQSPDDNWFVGLPAWMQLAASAGVFCVALAAGAIGYIRSVKSKFSTPQIPALNQTPTPEQQLTATLITEIRNLIVVQEKTAAAIATIARLTQADHDADEFERRVQAEVDRRQNRP